MATQGPSPGTTAVGNDTSVAPTSQVWTNASNALATDGAFATTTAQGDRSAALLVTGFGFTVPTGSTILGVTVAVEGKANAATAQQIWEVFLKKASAAVTAVKQATLSSTSLVTYTLGSAADLWGTTITPAEINAAGWGVGVKALNNDGATGVTYSVDRVTVTVAYTAPRSGAAFLTRFVAGA